MSALCHVRGPLIDRGSITKNEPLVVAFAADGARLRLLPGVASVHRRLALWERATKLLGAMVDI